MDNKNICPDCGKELDEFFNPITNTVMFRACICTREKAEQEKQEMLQRGLEKIKREIFSKNGIGRKYRGITLDYIIPVEGQEKAYNEAIDFLKRYLTDKHTKGFGLFGGVGSGKTYIVSALVNELCNKRIEALTEYEKEEAIYNRITAITPARLISCIELLESLKSDSEVIKKYKTAKLLVIDDFGAARITEWVDEKLFELVDFRYTNELPIIFTTNITPSELKEKLDKRTIDRLNEMCNFVPVTAPSQRLYASEK